MITNTQTECLFCNDQTHLLFYMKKLLLYISCFFLSGFGAIAQIQSKKDSLLKLIPLKKDTSLVLLYLDIGDEYEMKLNDYETAKKYFREAGSLSKKTGYKTGEIKFITRYTEILNYQGNYDSSLMLNKYSIGIAGQINDPVLLGKCYANTGNSYMYMNMYNDAIANYIQAKKHFSTDKHSLAILDGILQLLYQKMGRYKEAVEVGEASVDFLRKNNDSAALGRSLNNLGLSYDYLGMYAKAKELLTEALLIGRKTDDENMMAAVLISLTDIGIGTSNWDNTYISNATESLLLHKKLENPEGIAISYRSIGIYHFYKRNFLLALNYIDSSLAVCDLNNLREQKYKSLSSKSSVLDALHRLEEANGCLALSDKIKDSIINDQTREQVISAEKKYETEKKETQIKAQSEIIRQKNILNYVFAISAVVFLLALILAWRNYKHRRKLQQQRITELETEKQLAATEAVLKGEEQERTRLAKDLHDGLGGMLSGIKYSLNSMKENLIMTPDNAQAFERSIDMLDSSIKEMRRVAHNMMPEVLVKYGLDTALREFCYEINQSGVIRVSYHSIGMASSAIDQIMAVTIYRIVQELVNNSIKHAAAENVLVQVHVAEPEKLLTVTVEDDGQGFDTSALALSSGIGWKNIRSRVEFLKGKIDITSEKGNGTSVLIEMGL